MQAFISYVDDDGESTYFANWLNDALKRPGSPAKPWFAPNQLIPVNSYEKRLPRAVNSCDLLLFVRAEHTPDSNACMEELRLARQFGKPIITLRLESGYEHNPVVDHLPSVDFTKGHEQGLQDLFERIRTLKTPEGRIAQLEEKLRLVRDGFRRLNPVDLAASKKEEAALLDRLKELHAQAQVDSDALDLAPAAHAIPWSEVLTDGQEETENVLREVHEGRTPIVLIVGPEGVGKTRLVKSVIDQASTGSGAHRPLTEYRQVYGPQSFTAHDLTELLKGAVDEPLSTAATQLERLDVAIARKVEILMELLRDKRIVVVLDSCEVLLDADTGKLVSSDLDDALEVIARQRQTVVKLLMVTREHPFARPRRWLTRTLIWSFDKGMPLADFKKLLASLDPHDAYGLLTPRDELVETLYERTGGRPRAAEVVHGILASPRNPESEHSALDSLEDVVRTLTGATPDETLDFLTCHLIEGLALDVRRVLQAVSAFGIPVDVDAVAFMLPGEGVKQVQQSLRHLQASHLVRRTTEDLYYVQPPDDTRALQSIQPSADDEWDQRSLLLRAASYFALRRRTEGEVKRLSDLTAEFTEIDLLLQGGEFETAFRAIESVDDYLDNWGCRWLLRRQREQICGLLRDEMHELVNLLALGDIALREDDLAVAESCYRQAFSYLEVCNRVDYRQKLDVALGAVLQRRDEMAKAEDYYRKALAIAREHGVVEAEIVPLANLADCHRHWGQLDEAVRCLEGAAELARGQVTSAPGRDTRRRLAEIMLRLGSRYAEVGDFDRAETVLEEAGAHATEIDSWVTQCQYLDAMANLKLWQYQTRQAREIGKRGLELALELGRVPLQRQVYTTVAICSLIENDVDEAVEHIRLAARGRLPGHALTTLALNAVLEHRRGFPWSAQRLFRQLRLEAAERSRQDQRDFGALDMEGFARCGEHLGGIAPRLDAAIDVLHRARRVTRAPGITRQMVQLLTLFNDARLQPAIAAVVGD
ncbi:tetratricopeptide repeat protein [Actinophytocola sp.]|uniref:tetratricopeptide repeat protein n=1 Tax=Actinophytocola sp. TaxID=1872138 RepID=UPI00389A9B27